MRMGKIGRLRSVLRGMESTNASVAEIRSMLPELRELLAVRANLDRLGPRLDLLDQVGPRLELLDQLGGRLDRLGADIERIEALLRNIRSLEDAVGEADMIVRKYLDTNHVVAEDVRLDVDTISAVVLSAQKSIRDLTVKLEAAVVNNNPRA
jgi:hypothetical protein